jgi:predicted transcriptional regulator
MFWGAYVYVYALATASKRNNSNVHSHSGRLEELGLVEPTDDSNVSVPCDAMEILVPPDQVV